MNKTRREFVLIQDAAKELKIRPSLIYHWIHAGLLKVKIIDNPGMNPNWERINYYTRKNKYGQRIYGRSRLQSLLPDEFKWLVLVRDKMPELLNQRNTKALKIIKEVMLQESDGGG